MDTPHFTYKKRKCVRPQLTWGSSLPNRFFLDLEITFNFSHLCSFPFPPYFHCFLFYYIHSFYPFLFSPISPFLSSFIHPSTISQFYLTDSYINYYQSYIQYWLSSFQFPVSSALVIHYHNHILYNEKLFYFP